jgi:hydrogenase-4 component B
MKAGMFFLSLMTVVFGLAAVPVVKFLVRVAAAATLVDTGGMSFSLNNLILSPQGGKDMYLSTPVLALVFLVLGTAGFAVYKAPGREKTRMYRTWDCGYYTLNARAEYTATAFSKPFRIAFGFFLLPYRKTQKIRDSFYHVKSFVYETHTTMVFKKYLYDPALALIFKSAKSLRKMQPGSIHLYVLYIFAAAVLLFIFRGRF